MDDLFLGSLDSLACLSSMDILIALVWVRISFYLRRSDHGTNESKRQRLIFLVHLVRSHRLGLIEYSRRCWSARESLIFLVSNSMKRLYYQSILACLVVNRLNRNVDSPWNGTLSKGRITYICLPKRTALPAASSYSTVRHAD